MRMLNSELLTILTCLFLSGCNLPYYRQLPLPSGGQSLDVEVKNGIISALKSRPLPLTMRLLMDTTIEGSGRKESFRQALSFKRPGHLRLEAFAPGVNQLLFLVTSNDMRLQAVFPGEREVLVGRADGATFKELISVPLCAEELMVFIAAGILPSFGDWGKSEGYELNEQEYILSLFDESSRELRIIGRFADLPQIEQFSLSERGSVVLSGGYEYSSSHAVMPSRISFAIKEAKGEMILKNTQADITFTSLGIFQVIPPAGYRIQQIVN